MCVSVPGGLCVLRLFHCYRRYQIVSRMPPIIDLPECSTSLLANWRGGDETWATTSGAAVSPRLLSSLLCCYSNSPGAATVSARGCSNSPT